MKVRVQLMLTGLVALLISLQLVGSALETNAASLLAADQNLARQISTGSSFEQEVSLKNLSKQKSIRLSGGWEFSETGQAQSRFNDATIEGRFTGTRLELGAVLKGQIFELELDGSAARTIVAANTGQPGYVNLAAGLPETGHTFRLRLANRLGQPLEASGLRIDGYWNKREYSRRVRLMGYGSSTVDGSGITWKLAEAKGWECINRGIGGTTVINEGQHRVERDVLPFQPDVILVNYGSNDWFNNMPLDQFRQGFQQMMNRLASGLPESDFTVMGLFPRRGGNETTRVQFNQAMQEALQSSEAAGRARYLEMNGYNWDGMTVDGTHPNKQTISDLFIPQILPLFNRAAPGSASTTRQ